MSNRKDDLLIDTLHDLREALDTCIDHIDKNDPEDVTETYLIDSVEEEFHELNLKTNKIYTDLLSKLLEGKETKELIESKKVST